MNYPKGLVAKGQTLDLMHHLHSIYEIEPKDMEHTRFLLEDITEVSAELDGDTTLTMSFDGVPIGTIRTRDGETHWKSLCLSLGPWRLQGAAHQASDLSSLQVAKLMVVRALYVALAIDVKFREKLRFSIQMAKFDDIFGR